MLTFIHWLGLRNSISLRNPSLKSNPSARGMHLALGIRMQDHYQTVSLRITGPDRTFWAVAEISYHQSVYWLEESWIEPQVDRTVTQ